MDFKCQSSAIDQLQTLASADRHSVLVSGMQGSGKSYLAQRYADMLGIEDFQTVSPSVKSIKECMQACYNIDTPIVLCIENLDQGVNAAAYSILKFLEEPMQHVYIVVTCINTNNIPDTIISRCVVVPLGPPTASDLEAFATSVDFTKFHPLENTDLWKCVRTFGDVNTVLNLSSSQIDYFRSLSDILSFKDNISSLMWKLGHYDDNSEAPTDLILRYLIHVSDNPHVRWAGMECLKKLGQGRVAAHAVVARFLFECKYGA